VSWSQKVFAYCERGIDPSFWAEPVNAATNAGFIIAALAALALLYREPNHKRTLMRHLLIALVFIIGVGSFLFHTFATRWAAIADVAPIGIFMLAYLVFALRRFVGANVFWSLIGLAIFIGAMMAAGRLQCWDGQIGFNLDLPQGARGRCLNGSVSYLPAWGAMILIGGYLSAFATASQARRRTGPLVLSAGIVFTASIAFRSLDLALCQTVTIAGAPLGTHFMWHLLNALTLFLLLVAAIRHPSSADRQQVLPPRPARAY
jgi:hypothetical protein